jgi:hypothetical protein
MFSHWIVTNITSARGTFHYHKTRIFCVYYQLVVCGLYHLWLCNHGNEPQSSIKGTID